MKGMNEMKEMKGMFRRKVGTVLFLLFISFISFISYIYFFKPQPTGIPDKVLIRTTILPTIDSISVKAQLNELDYYLRSHRVTDEGYNQVAHYNTQLQAMRRLARLKRRPVSTVRHIKANERLLPVVKTAGGYWKAGRFHLSNAHFQVLKASGPGLMRDALGRLLVAEFLADTIVKATRTDTAGIYHGQTDRYGLPCGQGTYDATDGTHYEGLWQNDQRHGFGFESSANHPVRIGEWKNDRFLGEKLKYTSDRIYGIDISRHQHEKGRRRYAINWRQVRITSLGHRHPAGGQTFPISFAYIKSTESTSIRNRYFLQDYRQAKRQGIHVGAYHFFSLKTTALAQATYFVNHTLIHADDLPPVLDVEPTDAQINAIGGDDELMRRIRIFMDYVERRTHKRPILYVNQMFINKHMSHADDIKQRHNVWIARYSQYKPDVRLAFWQLSADGRVSGITGDVDINVFNGYQGQYQDFLRTGFHQ
jgi:lysozyme